MKKIILALMLTFILLIGLVGLRFGSALTQEENPIPILTAIMKLELTDKGYEKIPNSIDGVKYVSKPNRNDPYGVVKEFLLQEGWSFKEQMGSGLIFEKHDETFVVETRQYSKHYYLWNVPEEALD
ncbi:hypothetical protein JOC85_001967 [Bacillus mesophilus]|uniref:Uncharacterized protein n=1 Tax=Bacillus mesophilus TaxID=1808955 RepID=A0A6M0Q8D8_9BACI|nr:hypothetical protein [Bacillus mesophilus]NEY71278.1 hypothetical protein [Bacillus mesophilus]